MHYNKYHNTMQHSPENSLEHLISFRNRSKMTRTLFRVSAKLEKKNIPNIKAGVFLLRIRYFTENYHNFRLISYKNNYRRPSRKSTIFE